MPEHARPCAGLGAGDRLRRRVQPKKLVMTKSAERTSAHTTPHTTPSDPSAIVMPAITHTPSRSNMPSASTHTASAGSSVAERDWQHQHHGEDEAHDADDVLAGRMSEEAEPWAQQRLRPGEPGRGLLDEAGEFRAARSSGRR